MTEYTFILGTTWQLGLSDVKGVSNGDEFVRAQLKRAPSRKPPPAATPASLDFTVVYLPREGDQPPFWLLSASAEETEDLRPGPYAVDVRIEAEGEVLQSDFLIINVQNRITTNGA